MSDVAGPPHKEDEQEQNNTQKAPVRPLFYAHSTLFSKKGTNLVKFYPPPKPFCLNNSFFMHNFAPRKKQQRFAHIGNSVFRKSYLKNAYVFIATANQTKLKKKTSAKEHPQLLQKHLRLRERHPQLRRKYPRLRKKILKFFLIHRTRQ